MRDDSEESKRDEIEDDNTPLHPVDFEAVEGFLEEMSKLVTREDVHALLTASGKDKGINELKVASKIFAALKTVAEKAAREEVRNYAAEAGENWKRDGPLAPEAKPGEPVTPAEDAGDDSPLLELNGKRIVEPVPGKQYHGLDKLKIAISKPAQKVGKMNEKTTPVEVIRYKPKVLVAVEIPKGMLTTSRRITHYERAVEDALSTLWEAGIRKVTPKTVYLAMNGLPPDATVNPESIQKVDRAIYKLSKTWGAIDFPEEIAAAFKIGKAELKKLEGNVIMADRVTIRYENKTLASGWLLSDRRPGLFFLCSSLMHQVRTIPSECMNVKYLNAAGEEKPRQNTPNFMAMKHYLATQVKRIERKTDDDVKRILLETLIDELELDPAKREENPRPMTRAEKKRITEDVTIILEHFKRTPQARPLISGYKLKKCGNEIIGFDIEPRGKK